MATLAALATNEVAQLLQYIFINVVPDLFTKRVVLLDTHDLSTQHGDGSTNGHNYENKANAACHQHALVAVYTAQHASM